jgi:hypothetical protein
MPKPVWRTLFGSNWSASQRSKGVYANHKRHDILDRKGEPLQGGFSYFMGHARQVV